MNVAVWQGPAAEPRHVTVAEAEQKRKERTRDARKERTRDARRRAAETLNLKMRQEERVPAVSMNKRHMLCMSNMM